MAGGKHLLGKLNGRHIFGTVKVGEKGQIVIPKEARQLFDIQTGDTLLILGDAWQGMAIPPKDTTNKLFANLMSDAKDDVHE